MSAGDGKKQQGLRIAQRDGIHYLSGELNEFSDFSPLLPLSSPLTLNFRNVTRINSIGIRNLLRLVTMIPERLIEYRECPVALISQINMIPALLGKKASPERVQSFAIPYFCEACAHDFEVYQVTANVVADLKKEKDIVAECPQCRQSVGLDVEDYFVFLDSLLD